MHTLNLRFANINDFAELMLIINSAYRDQHLNSWTNESRIVSGDRIQSKQLRTLINQQTDISNTHFFVAELDLGDDTKIIGCIQIDFIETDAEIGTFCIAPNWQNNGFGQQLLKLAEEYAYSVQPKLKNYSMWVLNIRRELIDFYIRKGYQITGIESEYPLEANVGKPLIDLKLIQLVKPLSF